MPFLFQRQPQAKSPGHSHLPQIFFFLTGLRTQGRGWVLSHGLRTTTSDKQCHQGFLSRLRRKEGRREGEREGRKEEREGGKEAKREGRRKEGMGGRKEGRKGREGGSQGGHMQSAATTGQARCQGLCTCPLPEP